MEITLNAKDKAGKGIISVLTRTGVRKICSDFATLHPPSSFRLEAETSRLEARATQSIR